MARVFKQIVQSDTGNQRRARIVKWGARFLTPLSTHLSWRPSPGAEEETTPGVIWKSICHLAATLMKEPDHLMVEKEDGNAKCEDGTADFIWKT